MSALRGFIDELRRRGDLLEIEAPVDPRFEMGEIAQRMVRRHGPALLFRRPVGSDVPVVMNLLATPERIALALGRPPSAVAAELDAFMHDAMPPRWSALWHHRALLRRALSTRIKSTTRAAWQQTSGPGRLSRLPVLTCWPGDGGRFITWPLVLTRHPTRGDDNLGLYRMQVFSDGETGMHWQLGKGGAFHHDAAERSGRDLPCVVSIGADPLLMFAAMMPLPEGISETAFAGFLRGRPSRVVRLPGGLFAPEDAEIVLEGSVASGERRREGPFGDHYGHYSAAADFPVFRIARQWQRQDALYVAAVVGKPPQEDRALGNAVQEMFLPLLRLARPEVRDAWAWYETGFHALFTVSMRSRYEKESLKTAFSLLGEGQIALTKACVVVREEIDCRDIRAVLSEMRRRFDPARDVVIVANTSADTLEFAGPRMNHGSKLVLDFTGPEREAAPIETLPDLAARHAGVTTQRLVGDALLLVRVAQGVDSASLMRALVADASLRSIPLIALLSQDVDLHDDISWLWGLFTRFDPARDIVFRESRLVGAVAVHAGPMGVDATWKRGYPESLEMPPEVVARVDGRWRELGLPGG